MPHLTIRLFGPPQVELDGIPLRLEGRIPVALLVYLAVTGQLHTRDALATLFWPETGSPRTQLRNNLWIINRVLGSWSRAWLYSDHETIGLKSGADLWVDVAHFHGHLSAWRSHGHAELALCATCLAHLNEAVTLYRSDFLAGFTLRDSPAFDEWQFFQSERLRQQLARALEKLVHYHSGQGEWEAAIQHARRWLALDPLYEPAHRHLMQLYAWTGQTGAALRQYQECMRMLYEEMGVQPDPETTALYQALKTKQLSAPPVDVHLKRSPSPLPGSLAPPALRPSPHLLEQLVDVQDRPPNNLLEQLTPLVGREQERAMLQRLLRRNTVRLITLTGPGGVGKTRLALQAAADLLDEFADGCFFVPLAPIRDAGLVISAIAQVLGVRETVARSLLESVQIALRPKQILLVLDNFEHVVSAAPVVTALLAACPHLKILVTSREVLQVYGEHEFVVPSLATPALKQSTPFATLSQYEAVELFIQRAQAVKADFAVDNASAPAVAEICTRLDGLPLAIELAAARIKFFSPSALLKQLVGATGPASLKILQGGARDLPERHQTLRRAIAWSYDLLNAEEQTLFRKLAVFVGGFTLEAVVALYADAPAIENLMVRALGVIWPDPQLVNPLTVQPIRPIITTGASVNADVVLARIISLVNKSLVRQEEPQQDGEPRFTLLETIREYGLALLQERGELPEIQRCYASYYLALAVDAETQLNGADDERWLPWLEREYNNLRAVMDWAMANRAVDIAMRLGCALFHFWIRKGYEREGAERLVSLLPLTEKLPLSPLYARFLFCVALTNDFYSGDRVRSKPIYEQSLQVCRAVGDKLKAAHSLNRLAGFAYARGDYETWAAYLAEAQQYRRELNDTWGYALVHGHTGHEYAQLGRFAEGRAACEEALALHRAIGNKWGMILALWNFGQMALLEGSLDEAERLLLECLTLSQQLKDSYQIAQAQQALGRVATAQQRLTKAESLLRAALQTMVELTNREGTIHVLEAFAALESQQDQPARTLCLAAVVLHQRTTDGLRLPPMRQSQFDQMVASARQHLDQNAASTAWAEGEAMTLDEAVAYALAG